MSINRKEVMQALSGVDDPELPGVSIVDLGILRDVRIEGSAVTVVITPTYSGCPAMDVIRTEIRNALEALSTEVSIETVLSPPWTTDWLSEEAKRKLSELGIAPPEGGTKTASLVPLPRAHVQCPRCGSRKTNCRSTFGATACKSLWYCDECREPFEYFKNH